MIHSKKFFLAVLVFLSFLTGCNSSKKMLETGNYQQAVMQSVEKLKNSPDNKNAREVLAQAYPLAIESAMDRLQNSNAMQSGFINTESVQIYEGLNGLYENIQRSPAAKEIIPNPKKYYKELGSLKPLAAEEQYLAGLQQLEMGTRENFKSAYFYFREANHYVENYKDVADKMAQSYDLSILKVLTDLKPVQSRLYDLSADVFYKEVDKTLRQIEQNEFIRFFTMEEAEKMNITNPDQYLVLNFEDFVVGETHTKERVEKMVSDSVKVSEITLKDGKKREIFDVVTAVVTINRMEVISKGIIGLNISEAYTGNRVLINQDFAGEFAWVNEWGNFNGDKRALTEKQLAICQNKNYPPMPPQQMFVEFTKPIHAQLNSRLANFYKGY